MDKFYDINDFIVFAVKKWKTILAVIILAAIVFAGSRGFSLYGDYRAQETDKNSVQVQETSASENNTEPMWIKVQNVVEITADNPEAADESDVSAAVDAFRKLSGSESLLNAMYEKWYEEESAEYKIRVEKLHDYGYILDKEASYPYTKYDFYEQFLVNGREIDNAMSLNVPYKENYIVLGFKTTNENLARKIADDYTESLISYVSRNVEGFSFNVTDKSVLYDLPIASSGTQPTRVASASSSVSSITMKYIITQSIKGTVWGGIIGVLIAAVVILLMYMMTRKIYVLSDIRAYDVSLLGAGFLKNQKLTGLRARYHASLEGGTWDSTGSRKLTKYINEITAAKNLKCPVIVSGTCEERYIRKFVEILNAEAEEKRFVFGNSVTASVEVQQAIKNSDSPVLLIEMFGNSSKDNISFEIDELKKLNAEVLGMIVFE